MRQREATAARRRLRPDVVCLLLLLSAVGCEYQPPRFADRPPVWEIADDRPTSLPRRRFISRQLYYSDVYVRREIVNALDPIRTPHAVDVNSLDEVPRSSWYRPVDDSRRPLAGYRRDGPPVAPLKLVEVGSIQALAQGTVVTDVRGLRYELERDVPGRPEMRTAAAAIASRLVWALGYRTPEVWITRGLEGARVSATRWSQGVDLGRTLFPFNRSDDDNDSLPHVDRRSLRVLGMVAAWLGLSRLDPDMLRDVYVGVSGHGHVQHYLVGLGGALGVDQLLAIQEQAADPDRQDGNFFFRLATLGLSPKPPPPRAQQRWPALGQIGVGVVPDDYAPSPPFEPIDRVTAADGYWLAKRLAELPERALDDAIRAGQLSSAKARHRLAAVLRARRSQVVALAFSATSPCDAGRVIEQRGQPPRLVLLDRAIAHGHAAAPTSRYEIQFLDGTGDEIYAATLVKAHGPSVVVPLPRPPWGGDDYLVVRALATRKGLSAPRPAEIHLVGRGRPIRVIGLRH